MRAAELGSSVCGSHLDCAEREGPSEAERLPVIPRTLLFMKPGPIVGMGLPDCCLSESCTHMKILGCKIPRMLYLLHALLLPDPPSLLIPRPTSPELSVLAVDASPLEDAWTTAYSSQ